MSMFYWNYFTDGFLLSIFSKLFFFGPVGWIDPLISSLFSPIFYSCFFSSLSHTHYIYHWPYLPTLLLTSLFLLSCFISLCFLSYSWYVLFFFFYSILLLFHECNIFFYVSEYIGVCIYGWKVSSPISLVVSYLFVSVIFWIRIFLQMAGNPCLPTLI